MPLCKASDVLDFAATESERAAFQEGSEIPDGTHERQLLGKQYLCIPNVARALADARCVYGQKAGRRAISGHGHRG